MLLSPLPFPQHCPWLLIMLVQENECTSQRPENHMSRRSDEQTMWLLHHGPLQR